jgi:hypothetical protein
LSWVTSVPSTSASSSFTCFALMLSNPFRNSHDDQTGLTTATS